MGVLASLPQDGEPAAPRRMPSARSVVTGKITEPQAEPTYILSTVDVRRAFRLLGTPSKIRISATVPPRLKRPARIFHARIGLRVCLKLGVSVALPLP